MDANFQWSFDANSVQPAQGGRRHPPGNKFPFAVTDAKIEGSKDNSSGMLTVELTSDMGSIEKRYSLWHANPVTVDIAKQQLSALCHAIGRFTIANVNGKVPALIGGRGMMDVAFQKGQEPSAEKPEGGYVEVAKVYDAQGNEPGKAPQQQPNNGFQQPQQQQPQPQTGFVAPQGNAAPQANGSGWQAPNQQPQQQPQQQPNPNQGGWTQNAANGANGAQASPPWNRG